jgi:glycosyltransferase involved in cell wall biosynthesis
MKNKTLKVALVHDYIKDAGGAERVLRVLADMYPQAPIYTSFRIKNSEADKLFLDRKIVESSFAPILRPWRLYSPLRFLHPWIWGSLDLSEFDLVITSCSNYVARGFKVGPQTKVVAYCHTPPRFLYGMKTGMDWRKNMFIRIYGEIIAHFLRIFDYNSAQKIEYWIANSKNVQARIQKFYRKDSTVIYPPVNVDEIVAASKNVKKKEYFLITSRLVGSKGLIESVEVANVLHISLKIAGKADGFTSVEEKLKAIGGANVEFLGRVSDAKLWKLYAEAKGFIALARDEDFGMSVVEAQAGGTPVIAFNGGGFKESIIDGKTGILINDTSVKALKVAFEKFKKTKWNNNVIQTNAQKFSREKFEKETRKYIQNVIK